MVPGICAAASPMQKHNDAAAASCLRDELRFGTWTVSQRGRAPGTVGECSYAPPMLHLCSNKKRARLLQVRLCEPDMRSRKSVQRARALCCLALPLAVLCGRFDAWDVPCAGWRAAESQRQTKRPFNGKLVAWRLLRTCASRGRYAAEPRCHVGSTCPVDLDIDQPTFPDSNYARQCHLTSRRLKRALGSTTRGGAASIRDKICAPTRGHARDFSHLSLSSRGATWSILEPHPDDREGNRGPQQLLVLDNARSGIASRLGDNLHIRGQLRRTAATNGRGRKTARDFSAAGQVL